MTRSPRPFAIVTGGTKGIGAGVTEMLFSRGYNLIVTYGHDEAAARALAERCMSRAAEGQKLSVIRTDHSSRESTYRLAEAVRHATTHVDCIVCNAGMTVRKSLTDTLDRDWDAMMETNVNSHYIIVRELFPIIPHGSRILFTGSDMAIYPHASVLGYAVTKAAVHALAENLVKEFEGTGTTVNTIAPGFVDTPWQHDKPEEIRHRICQKTAIHRFATVGEVVGAFEFCIDNPFVNGAVIKIDGGYCFK